MTVKTRDHVAEVACYSDGCIGHLFGNGDGRVAATEVTAVELSLMDIKVDKQGRRYVQKGGQRRIYIDDAVISDRDGVTVMEYLSQTKTYEVTITYKVNVTVPAFASAGELYAAARKEVMVRHNIDPEFSAKEL